MYDPQTVKAFLGSSAVELMIGGILYEAIFEFTKKADVFGGIVNSLPIIGFCTYVLNNMQGLLHNTRCCLTRPYTPANHH